MCECQRQGSMSLSAMHCNVVNTKMQSVQCIMSDSVEQYKQEYSVLYAMHIAYLIFAVVEVVC